MCLVRIDDNKQAFLFLKLHYNLLFLLEIFSFFLAKHRPENDHCNRFDIFYLYKF